MAKRKGKQVNCKRCNTELWFDFDLCNVCEIELQPHIEHLYQLEALYALKANGQDKNQFLRKVRERQAIKTDIAYAFLGLVIPDRNSPEIDIRMEWYNPKTSLTANSPHSCVKDIDPPAKGASEP